MIGPAPTDLIAPCGGEQCHWHCLGPDAHGAGETKAEFNERRPIDAWQIVERLT